ncbi:hypothetical protein F8O06_09685 [Pseudoclavibacter sp. CFCC 14310]|uniref:hypothetical protein n=1 Tax=Pseudoclavibacter sp. CFCC 14310 TaxID=2615180 RepID=UPI00130171D1|nr:hypothetical protein [Pseudoclavibacter sp. CFCC 14310]KAB1644315.1 hypothetical protein F8O06_09685 [Pseudoclavibacter sp. CFCC 14310]
MTTKCPYCFATIDADSAAWVCNSGLCEAAEDLVASQFSFEPVYVGPMLQQQRPPDAPRSWSLADGVCCRSCGHPMQEACVNCHRTLPPNWRQTNTVCISMSGARTTGKSLYVAVVVQQLRAWAQQVGTAMMPADENTQQNYKEIYEDPLYAERGLMQMTPSAKTGTSYQREPLIFSLGRVQGVPWHLVIRDVAGEDMENPPQGDQFSFLAHADAIFFMFDPLTVKNVRDRLIDLIPAPGMLGGEPISVLANLLRLTEYRPQSLAIILSKFDAVQALKDVDDADFSPIMSNSGAALFRDPSRLSPQYDQNDGALLSEEVRSLLFRLGAQDIVSSVENSATGQPIPHRFFAVSALGESPEGEELSERGIVPFRCLDPMKWAMSNQGVLPVR